MRGLFATPVSAKVGASTHLSLHAHGKHSFCEDLAFGERQGQVAQEEQAPPEQQPLPEQQPTPFALTGMRKQQHPPSAVSAKGGWGSLRG